MYVINKPLESIEEADLRRLIDEQVGERKQVEYKSALPGRSDAEKREFLADISSFANASGGDFLYGIREEAGLPKEICGLDGINPDQEKLRLLQSIQYGIQPRIPGVGCHFVTLSDGKFVCALRVPRSWTSPHMVTFQNLSRFYSRNSGGKYQLDVGELRAAFALSETTAERIRNFRLDRLGKIMADETPVSLEKNAKIVLHVMPLSAFGPPAGLDIFFLNDVILEPIRASSSQDYRYNFDGVLTYCNPEVPYTYLQIFRNGIVEAVDASLLRNKKDKLHIPVYYEAKLVKAIARYLNIQKQLGIQPPILIMLSLLGVRGYRIDDSQFPFARAHHPIDRDTLSLPEIMIETYDIDITSEMKCAFDQIWNAAGWPRSMNYTKEGKWNSR